MINDTASEITRILLIEDNAADIDLMKYALDKQHFHYALSTLKDGAEALAFIRKEGKYARAPQPDLIVMDLHLPKNDGLEVLEEIRKNPEFNNLLVAVLSSSVSPEEKNSVAAFERTCFIRKPLDLNGFMTVATTIRRLSREGKGAQRGRRC
jgi:chemotaxis family two-component system response regulator Rcp1